MSSDLYAEIEGLIAKLESAGYRHLAEILSHRIHKVAWTSGSELMDELARTLEQVLQGDFGEIGANLQQDVRNVLNAVRGNRVN
jgi:HPt (histidine-containing phosphotransfer) domain-containing protein